MRYHTRNSIFTAFIELQVPGVYVHRVQQGVCPPPPHPPPVYIKLLKCCLDGFLGILTSIYALQRSAGGT